VREKVARRMFGVAWIFFAVATAIGLLLRVQAVAPVDGINYGHLLHTHSHVAFLGWVFNAFFALAMCLFVTTEEQRTFVRLFWVTQLAVVGMLIAYPIEGYARWSIAASTLHMLCSGVFAWRLWRGGGVADLAGRYLKVALAFMLISGAGPLALGPLAVSGLRDSPWYLLAIYFYLHCQYNGWFIFFLQAALLRWMRERGANIDERGVRRALRWLVAGVVLTFALSTLWTEPPAWVRAAALLGGAAQVVGAIGFWQSVRGGVKLFSRRDVAARWLGAIAVGAYALKVVLQFVAAWPGGDALAVQRPVAIGFLHLVFLGVVTPLLIVAARARGWMRRGWFAHVGLGLYVVGALLMGVFLAWPAGAGNAAGLVVAAGLSAAGVLGLGATLWGGAARRET
jgi:hypothetical protein